MRIELVSLQTSGDEAGKPNWAEIADKEELRSGDIKAVRRATRMMRDADDRVEMNGGFADDINDAMLTRVVRSWTLPHPLPSANPGSLDVLELADYDALCNAIDGHVELMNFRSGASS